MLSEPQGLERLEGLGKLIKCIRIIVSRTLELPACSIVPQPLSYRVPLLNPEYRIKNRQELGCILKKTRVVREPYTQGVSEYNDNIANPNVETDATESVLGG
jgi:hypothetical protein